MYEAAEIKINRIKSANRGALGLLGEALNPDVLGPRVAKIQEAQEAIVEHRAIMETMSTLGKHVRTHGFDPTRTFQHVAKIDNAIWQVILGMFARYDETTGEFMDDGLLYKYDPQYGCVRLNKPFFFAILSFMESCGHQCDLRNKIKL
jgi:hypothetical protein